MKEVEEREAHDVVEVNTLSVQVFPTSLPRPHPLPPLPSLSLPLTLCTGEITTQGGREKITKMKISAFVQCAYRKDTSL